MRFAAPAYGWLLPVVAVVALLALRAARQRSRQLLLLAEAHLAEQLTAGIDPRRRFFREALLVAALLFMVIALMRPQWGMVAESRVTTGLDIVIAVDVSRSMLAVDLPPSRLSAAQAAIGRLLDGLAGDRIGLVAFAGSAFLVCPLTSDYDIVRQVLADLGPGTIAKGGSSIAAPLVEARRAFRGTRAGSRVLIVVSDGEDHGGAIAPALEQLRSERIMVFAALAGTGGGGLMPLPGSGFVKDRQGAVVKSRASLATMAAIDPGATALGADGSGLVELLQRAKSVTLQTERHEQRQRLAERYQMPLAAGIFLLCLSYMIPERRRG